MTVRVLVISPFPTVRAGLHALLSEFDDLEIVGDAVGAGDVPGPWSSRADVALADAAAGPEVLRMAAELPAPGIVLLGVDPPRTREGWGAAPRGFLASDATGAEIAAAVRAVAQGLTVIEPALLPAAIRDPALLPAGQGAQIEEPLTPRELEVLQLLAAGLPNKTIAIRLGISEHTAKFHVSSVLAKLRAGSRTEAVTTAARRGLLLL